MIDSDPNWRGICCLDDGFEIRREVKSMSFTGISSGKMTKPKFHYVRKYRVIRAARVETAKNIVEIR